jgi:hypothetical protein
MAVIAAPQGALLRRSVCGVLARSAAKFREDLMLARMLTSSETVGN